MCRLSDRLYRRTVELFLLAGSYNGKDKDGSLPSVEMISWRLRLDEDELENDLTELAKVGIVFVEDDRWTVTNFSKRQESMPKGEYMQRLREERRKKVFHSAQLPDSDSGVTNQLPKVTQNRIEQNKKEQQHNTIDEAETVGVVFAAYQNNINAGMGSHEQRIINEWIDTFPHDWILSAIHIAVENNKRKISYINGILKNYKEAGHIVTYKEKQEANTLKGYSSA